jgi:hypothetical protein
MPPARFKEYSFRRVRDLPADPEARWPLVSDTEAIAEPEPVQDLDHTSHIVTFR